jgi:predicted TIM-barrel fold metal-dependent hydrolase
MTGLADAHLHFWRWTTYAALVGAHRAGIPATDHDHVFNRAARRVYRLGQ